MHRTTSLRSAARTTPLGITRFALRVSARYVLSTTHFALTAPSYLRHSYLYQSPSKNVIRFVESPAAQRRGATGRVALHGVLCGAPTGCGVSVQCTAELRMGSCCSWCCTKIGKHRAGMRYITMLANSRDRSSCVIASWHNTPSWGQLGLVRLDWTKMSR